MSNGKCINCDREFQNVLRRPVRDLIWNKVNEHLGGEYLKPLYQQLCHACRLKLMANIIETIPEEIEKEEK